MKDKSWDIQMSWIMMKSPNSLNYYKEVMNYSSG